MAFTNETNVADFYCRIMFPRVGLPESVAISGILERKLFTEDIILHRYRSRQRAKLTSAVIRQLLKRISQALGSCHCRTPLNS